MIAKRIAAAIVASLAWTACSVAGPTTTARIEQGRDFSLKAGESAQTSDGALKIGFDDVVSDSRCPKGEQCIRAGDVTARIWVQQGSGPKETRELQAAVGATRSVRVLDRFVSLVRVDPIAVTGKSIAKSDYVATLRWSLSGNADAER